MEYRKKVVFSAIISIWSVMIVYIILHEAGHCLIAILCGAQVTEFSIISAHMSYIGGTFSSATAALLNVAGMLLPVVLAFVYTVLYRKNTESVFYRVFSLFFCGIPIFSILAWVLVPVLAMLGAAPVGDDATMFLINSGIHPIWVLLSALLLFALLVMLAWRKRIAQNYWQTFRAIRTQGETQR